MRMSTQSIFLQLSVNVSSTLLQKKRIALLYFNTKSNFIRTNKNTKNYDNFIISSITNKQKLKSERKKK